MALCGSEIRSLALFASPAGGKKHKKSRVQYVMVLLPMSALVPVWTLQDYQLPETPS